MTRAYVDPTPGVAVVGKESMYSIEHLTSLGKRVLRRRVCNAIQKTPMFRSGKPTRPPAPIQELHLRAAKPELRQQTCDRWRRLLASGRGQAQ
ncbi:hypothetical protein J6590_098770 [Homalodisca vitripennis]|nr:hypothetical protein J6590_098770 [Homalodisca vitripennis]